MIPQGKCFFFLHALISSISEIQFTKHKIHIFKLYSTVCTFLHFYNFTNWCYHHIYLFLEHSTILQRNLSSISSHSLLPWQLLIHFLSLGICMLWACCKCECACIKYTVMCRTPVWTFLHNMHTSMLVNGSSGRETLSIVLQVKQTLLPQSVEY